MQILNFVESIPGNFSNIFETIAQISEKPVNFYSSFETDIVNETKTARFGFKISVPSIVKSLKTKSSL